MVSGKTFKFSFVMPVYNVEEYLDETVQSILGQTLDFKENCEIIFINDGSPDNVEEICLKYQKQFPENIKYYKQKNSGVSAARNKGIELAEGEIISFLDSDDLISSDTLARVDDFFQLHGTEIDVVSIKMQFFEAATNPHMLNYKFHTTRVVDIEKEYDSIQLSAPSAFIRKDAIKGVYSFDDRLTVSEDAVFINQVILAKMKYGVIKEPTYYYRRRISGGSAMNKSTRDKRWYLHTPRYAHKYLADYSREVVGYLPRYIKFLLMYDMQWRLKQETQTVLSPEELASYKETLIDLLKDIDDDIIIEQKYTNAAQKLFILEKKYGKVSPKLTKKIYCKYNPPVWIEFLTVQDNTVSIEGHINYSLKSGYSLVFDYNNTPVPVRRVARPKRYKTFLGEEAYDGGGYALQFPLENQGILRAYLVNDKGDERLPVPIRTRRFSRLADTRFAYRVDAGRVITMSHAAIEFKNYSLAQHIFLEIRWLARILLGIKLRYSWELLHENRRQPGDRTTLDKVRPVLIPLKAMAQNITTVFYRTTSRVLKAVQDKPVWIISDRTTAAGDNGEALFKYVNTLDDLPVKVYFAIAKNSPDYEGARRYGTVLPWGSIRYKLNFLIASKIISSHADDFIVNPFGARLRDFQDIMNFDYVFLQHGITKDDISGWLNRYNKNIALFITAAKPEYKSLLSDNYGYTEDQVALTGFPRYDLLANNPKRKIIIAPTWRRILTSEANQRTGTRGYDENFKKSDYFTFYQSLLSDKKILAKLEEKNMTIEFYLHPSHAKQRKDYTGSERVSIMAMPYDYKKAFTEGTILVTDYSSVAFDFAYLSKPVVYAQFDREEFFEGHLYQEGYFSYEANGFGPVSYTYDDTVKNLIQLIDEDGRMPEKYQSRLKEFFYKFDTHNSQRVYAAIQDIDNKKTQQ